MAQQGDETILDEAKSLLVQGKRFIALEDYQAATDCLEQSCQLFDAFYGVAKRECADAYLEYGLALVALANLEAGSGTDKIMKKAGIQEEDDDEEEDEEEADDEVESEEQDDGENKEQGEENKDKAIKNEKEEKAESNMETDNEEQQQPEIKTTVAENGPNVVDEQVPMESSSTSQEATKINGASADTDDGVTKNEQSQPQTSSSSAPEPTPGTSSVDCNDADVDGDDEESEEATTIEIAWEVLCLAKRVFMNDESLDGRLKLAETLQKIGEISIEWDNNDNAVSILEECLQIRTAILKPDDRLIALTYYNLGLAHSFKSDIKSANDNFQKAINVIEKRISSLSEDLEEAKAAQDTVALGAYQKEIHELKELLPDMTMRIDDSKEDEQKSTDMLKRTREEMQLEDEEAKKVCSDRSKPVDDISHLVKRKAA